MIYPFCDPGHPKPLCQQHSSRPAKGLTPAVVAQCRLILVYVGVSRGMEEEIAVRGSGYEGIAKCWKALYHLGVRA